MRACPHHPVVLVVVAVLASVGVGPGAGCAPWVQTHGPTASLALERDPIDDTFSPRVGVGYGYQIHRPTFVEAPTVTWAGAGGGIEVAYAPFDRGVEVAAEGRIVLPLLLVAGVGAAMRSGWRFDPHREGEPFFELAVTFAALQGVRIPSDFCDPAARGPVLPHSDRACPPHATGPEDVIHGDWVGLVDIYPFRDWADVDEIQTYGAVRWVFGVQGPTRPGGGQ